MSDVQAEVVNKLSDLSAQIRELVIELRHTQRNYDNHEGRIQRNEEGIRQLQLEAALNKPILDIARAMNTKMWVTILGSALTVGALSVDWAKAFGG